MLRKLYHGAPLLLIALAVSWGILALVCKLLADARWISILWPSLERLFLDLAVVSTAVAVAAIVWQSAPCGSARRAHFLRFGLGATGLVAAMSWITASVPDVGVGLLALGATLGIVILLDRRLPPRPEAARVA